MERLRSTFFDDFSSQARIYFFVSIGGNKIFPDLENVTDFKRRRTFQLLVSITTDVKCSLECAELFLIMSASACELGVLNCQIVSACELCMLNCS